MPITKTEEQTYKLAEKIAKKTENGGLICLFGDLGSGKTTFTKGIAHFLGIDKFSIKSPTYTYIRKHKTKKKTDFYHIDLYRLDKIDELLLQELNELFENDKNIIVIEWADRMQEELPENKISIYFKYINTTSRELIFK